VEQVDAPSGEEANDPLDNHQPAEQGTTPNDLLCRPAAEQAQPSLEDEADDPEAQFTAWRRRVASYALEIKAGDSYALVDDLLKRLKDGETQSNVTREEVEAVVLTLTETIMGGTAPIKRT
jgi:hypothetical protein